MNLQNYYFEHYACFLKKKLNYKCAMLNEDSITFDKHSLVSSQRRLAAACFKLAFTRNSMRGDDFMVAFWSFLNLAALLYLIYLLVKIVKKIK